MSLVRGAYDVASKPTTDWYRVIYLGARGQVLWTRVKMTCRVWEGAAVAQGLPRFRRTMVIMAVSETVNRKGMTRFAARRRDAKWRR